MGLIDCGRHPLPTCVPPMPVQADRALKEAHKLKNKTGEGEGGGGGDGDGGHGFLSNDERQSKRAEEYHRRREEREVRLLVD